MRTGFAPWRVERLRDGNPNAALRAANARAAARIVIQQAKREARISRMAIAALVSDLPARATTPPPMFPQAGEWHYNGEAMTT